MQTVTKPTKQEKSQHVSVILALLHHESHDLGRSFPQFTRINSRREQIKVEEEKAAKTLEADFLAFDEECLIRILKAGLSSEMFS